MGSLEQLFDTVFVDKSLRTLFCNSLVDSSAIKDNILLSLDTLVGLFCMDLILKVSNIHSDVLLHSQATTTGCIGTLSTRNSSQNIAFTTK
jgi:hypothetical protein